MVLNMFRQIKVLPLLFIFIFFLSKSTLAEDIISSNSGGKVIHWTLQNAPNIAYNLIDDDKTNYWSSGELVFPQVITFSMPINKRFEGFSVTAKNEKNSSTWAKKIRISSADPFPHMGGWVELVELELPANGEEYFIKVNPYRGRYFRLEIFSTHGIHAKEVSLKNFSVYDVVQ